MKIIYLLLFFILIHGTLFSQIGSSLVKNYNTSDFHSEGQNWAVVQKSNGITYFGNNKGVLEYDGENWNIIKLPNNSVIRRLAIKNDTVYIGANNEFGLLITDSIGKTIYKSLSKGLSDEYKRFDDIWDIKTTQNKVYFVSYDNLFIYKNNTVTRLKIPFEYNFVKSVSGEFIIISDSNIYVEDNNKFVNIHKFKDKTPTKTIVKTINNELILIKNNGNYKVSINKYLSDNFIVKLDPNLFKEIRNKSTFSTNIGKNGDIVVCTKQYGGYVYDKNFKLINVFGKKTGIPTNSIYSCTFDNYENLFITHDIGISYIELNSPFTKFDENNNASEVSLYVNEYKNKLYIGSMGAIKILKKGTSKLIDFKDALHNNFSSCIMKTPKDSVLFMTSDNIIFFTNGEKITKFYELEDKKDLIISITWSEKYSNKLFLGTTKGLRCINLNINNKIITVDSLIKINNDGMTVSVVIDDESNIWAAPIFTKLGKVSLYKNNETIFYGKNKGLNETNNLVFYNKYSKKIYVVNNKLFVYNSEKDTFIVDTSFFDGVSNLDKVVYYTYNKKKSLLFTKNNIYSIDRLNKNNIDSISYKRLSEFAFPVSSSLIASNNIEWFPFTKYIFKFNPEKTKSVKYKPLPIIISNIILNDTNIIYYGRDTNILRNIAEIDYKYNSIKITYAEPYFVANVKYKYKLEGFNNTWTKYSDETKATYTNLSEGKYTFKVKAINVYGFESDAASYTFTINPPWYRTILMYILYFIIVILIVSIIIYLFTRNLKERNKRLEKIVRERTKEIQDKNILITDSINYAKHIQKAVLPSISTIKNTFINTFVYFKPRDIVSGDFYWYKQRNKSHFIAVSDCTGHGVPGAFMSMIGNTLLNQIITEPSIKTPADVLNRLNTEVKVAFSDSDSQDDGMDITVCKINYEKGIFELSLANHIALILKDGKIEEIHGDIYSIGGPFAKPEDESFTNITNKIEKGTNLYMFSDGYTDQFGGSNNKKLNISEFKQLLINIADKEMSEQYESINEYFYNWKGNYKQIDDVLVFGIKF